MRVLKWISAVRGWNIECLKKYLHMKSWVYLIENLTPFSLGGSRNSKFCAKWNELRNSEIWAFDLTDEASLFEDIKHCNANFRRRLDHCYSSFSQCLDFVLGSTFSTRNNGCKIRKSHYRCDMCRNDGHAYEYVSLFGDAGRGPISSHCSLRKRRGTRYMWDPTSVGEGNETFLIRVENLSLAYKF